MKTTEAAETKQVESKWPRKVQPGRATVTVYRRQTSSGNWNYMVANYCSEDGGETKRRFDSYPSEAEALEAAAVLARRLDRRDYVAASLNAKSAAEYVNAVDRLKPFGVTVDEGTAKLVECLKLVGSLAQVSAACEFFCENQKHFATERRTVEQVVKECISVKRTKTKHGRAGSEDYVSDLECRLPKFASAFTVDISTVTTGEVQRWLDGLKLAPQSIKNYRTVLNTLFTFAETRGYIRPGTNPVQRTEKINADTGEIVIFTPDELERLLTAAQNPPADATPKRKKACADFLAMLAIGAFAGPRAREIGRLQWEDIDLAGGWIHIGKKNAKTRSRRLVPIHPTLGKWLSDYSERKGKVWSGTANSLQKVRRAICEAAGVRWKKNALRHSYISYRLAETQNENQLASESGHSPQMIYQHYRQVVKPDAATKWFALVPERPANVVTLAQAG